MNRPPYPVVAGAAQEPLDEVSTEPPLTLRRVIDGITVAVIIASMAAVLVASTPVLVRLLQGETPAGARRGIERAMRSRGWAVGPAKPKDSRYAPSVSDFPHESLLEQLDRARDSSPFDNAEGRPARPRGRITLLDRGDRDGEPVLTVDEHDALIVVRDTGTWLLLATHRGDRVHLGWATRDQIEVAR